jgi:oligoendopeptidase F
MAWRLAARRRLEDREKINELWKEFYASRQQLASNAGMNSYLDYRWQQMHRFDYTPADCETFRQAILEVAVPAATRVYQRRQERLGLDSLRPWDLSVDPLSRPPLRPFKDVDVLKAKTSTVFTHVDGELGQYFDIMIRENLLDLDNRKNKAPGGYCTQFPAARVPFIFMNSVGVHDNVQTLLHEGGHCFHVFESRHLPYYQQQDVGIEFAEVASMAMELLALPYIEQEYGGFYSPAEAARARAEHLEGCLLFWPYMAVVDAFQQWAYQNPLEAEKPSKCDAQWKNLWEQFIPGVDWSGLEDELVTGWHRKLHIFCYPLYYVEYGLAQLGAAQVWRNALEDQSEAVKNYRRALSLGGTEPLPELFRTAGAKFAFDASTLSAMVELLEENLVKQEELAGQE